jgi:CBS domain containing-hemolysin-like protein
MTGVPVGLLLVLGVLGIGVATALSAGEAAIGRLTRSAVAELSAVRRPWARRTEELAAQPDRTVGAFAFVRLTVETLSAALVTLALAALLPSWWLVVAAVLVASVGIAMLRVRVGPRARGSRAPLRVLRLLSPILGGAARLGGPTGGMAGAVRWSKHPDPALAGAELRDIVDRVRESDQIEEDERDMLRSVFTLGSTLAREVMVPRTDMVTIDAGTPLRKAMSLFMRSGYSRVPVIGTSVDDLLGVVYLKDVILRVRMSAEREADAVESVMRPPVYVPESKPVDDLLREMQGGLSHMGIVVDEYGGVAGLVTIEDALEEIVGELTDEHDRSGPDVEELGNGIFRIPARLPLDELGELFDLEIDDDEVDTAAGLLAKARGKVPLPGTEAVVQGVRLRGERSEGRRHRIATLLVQRAEDGRNLREPERGTVDGSTLPAGGSSRRHQEGQRRD